MKDYIKGKRFYYGVLLVVTPVFSFSQTGNQTIGVNAGQSITTGDFNCFFGDKSGMNTTSGNSNQFLGYKAGYYNETGSYNTFIGHRSGYYNTASHNSAVGHRALYKNTTGVSNSAFGKETLFNNTTGQHNLAMGYGAGYYNETGSYNTFVGYRSGHSNQNGAYNAFSGYKAGYDNTSGYSNCALGYGALYNNNSGYQNVAMGYKSLYNNTSGKQNVAIGLYAGYSNQTGEGNVFIGEQAGYSETGSNKLYIDNINTINPLIYGDFSANFLKFNGDITVVGDANITGLTKPKQGIETGCNGTNSELTGQYSYRFGYQEGGNWTNPYPDLVLGYHTGVSIGGHTSYGGTRFFNDHPSRTETVIAAIGDGQKTYFIQKVGIGTDDPESQFEVEGESRFDGSVIINSLAGSGDRNVIVGANGLLKVGGTTSGGQWGEDTDSENNPRFYTTRKVKLIGNGTLGEPSILLDVDGDGNSGGEIKGTWYGGVKLLAQGQDMLDVRPGVVKVKTELEVWGGNDLAEPMDIVLDEKSDYSDVLPGMVVSIDPNNAGKLRLCNEEYDTKVAGIISGANGVKTALTLGDNTLNEEGAPLIALSGRVYVYADASEYEILPGDMLTSSETLGYAQKVTEFAKAHGAVIGKAMTSLKKGEKGMVLVLVNLH